MAEQNLGKVAVTTGGTYASSKAYDKLTIVNHNGASWISKTAVPAGNAPSESSSYWQLLLGASVPRIAMTSTSASINPNTFYVWGEVASLDITLNEGASAEENRYMFQFRNPKSGATVLTLPDDILWSVDTELGDDGLPLFGNGEYTRIEIIEGLASVKKWALPYIIFADAEVERVLLANGVGDGTGITKQEAAAVTSIGTWFSGNTVITSFEELRYFTKVTLLVTDQFLNCTSLMSVSLDNIVTIGQAAFRGCSALSGDLSLPKATTIGWNSFMGCAISSVNAPELVEIRQGAFTDCANMRTISIPKVTTIITNAFMDCSSLEQLILPFCETIGNVVFRNCTSLTLLEMGANTKSIGNNQFGDHTATMPPNLGAIVVRATTPPTLGSNGWYGTTCPIYVPDASVEAYKTATNWNSYAARIKGISKLPTE